MDTWSVYGNSGELKPTLCFACDHVACYAKVFPLKKKLGGLLASAWARQGETQKAAQWLAPGGGLGLAAESDSKRIVAMSWNLGAAASSYLSFLLAQEPRVLGALSLLLSDPSS